MSTHELLQEGLVPTPGKRVRRGGLHALTGIRFFAALWVMLFHFGAGFFARAHVPALVTNFLTQGYLGVALFFMLSGFILYYAYQGNLNTSRDLYKFFVARFARVYPVYLLAILIVVLMERHLPRGYQLIIFPLLQSWTPPTSHSGAIWIMQAWTLSVELFFYCAFPLIFRFLDRNHTPRVLWALICSFFIVAVGLHVPAMRAGMESTWLTSHMLLPVLCLPEFILGVLLGALFLHKQKVNPNAVTNDWITVAGLVPCFVLIASGWGQWATSLGAVAGFGWAIYRLANGRGWLTTLLSTRVMLLLGGASFSLYLLQGPTRVIVHLAFNKIHPGGLDAIAYPFILIALSCLIFLGYEEPMRDRVRDLLIPRRAPRTS